MKTTTHQTPFLSEIESGNPIPIGKLAYLRERTRLRLYDFIVSKFIDQSKKAGLTQAELGRRVRKSPEVVNRLLGAPGNWTLDTISDLLAGIGAEELEPHSISLLNRLTRNHTAPDWLDAARIPFVEQEKEKRKASVPKTLKKTTRSPDDKQQSTPALELTHL